MKAIELYNISNHFQWAGSLLIAISCLLHFKFRPSYIKVLGAYAVISVCFSLAQNLFGSVGVIGNIFTLVEVWAFSFVFYYAYNKDISGKKVLTIATLYTIFYGITFLFFLDRSYSFVRSGRDLTMIVNAILFFYFLIKELPEENLLKFPMYWISASVIFFFSGTFILSFLINYITDVLKESTAGFWAFRNFFRFGFCMVIAYACLLDFKSIKSIRPNP